MPAQTLLMTAEQLLDVNMPDKWTELVRGHLVVREPPSTWHGVVAGRLARLFGQFVHENGLGEVCAQDTGFKIASNPDTVRAPDAAFIAKERVKDIARRGYAAMAPDIVVEVLSPDDRAGEVMAKVGDWLDAGVRLVWVLDPDRREARVHKADGSLRVIMGDGALDGDDILPGFRCPLRPLFA